MNRTETKEATREMFRLPRDLQTFPYVKGLHAELERAECGYRVLTLHIEERITLEPGRPICITIPPIPGEAR